MHLLCSFINNYMNIKKKQLSNSIHTIQNGRSLSKWRLPILSPTRVNDAFSMRIILNCFFIESKKYTLWRLFSRNGR